MSRSVRVLRRTRIAGYSRWNRLIASSIQVVAEDHGWEKWMNLPHERERLYRLIRETGAEGMVFLSGDRAVVFE